MMRLLLIAAGLSWVASGVMAAPSPRAELKAAIEQLQKTPDDAALREKIIKLAAAVKPAPAIPEAAREHFIMATTMQKNAKSAADYARAIEEYKLALLAAPWWGDAYYNLAVAQESAARYDDAVASLKLFLASKPKEADARRAQDHIYALKARKKMKESEDDAKAVEEARRRLAERSKFIDSILGHWQWGNNTLNIDVTRGPDGGAKIVCGYASNGGWVSPTGSEVEIDAPRIRFKCTDADGFTQDYDLSLDGSGKLVGTHSHLRNGEPMMFNGHAMRETESYTR